MQRALISDLDLQKATARPMVTAVASTKLNICAILSLLGK